MRDNKTPEYNEGYEDYYKEKANSNPYKNNPDDMLKADDYDMGYDDAREDDLDHLDDVY